MRAARSRRLAGDGVITLAEAWNQPTPTDRTRFKNGLGKTLNPVDWSEFRQFVHSLLTVGDLGNADNLGVQAIGK